MNEDKSTVDDFLGNVNEDNKEFIEKQDPFADDTLEVKEEKVEEKEEKVPFHKDPKIMRFIEKEVSKRIPKASEEQTFKQDVKEDDDYYVRLIGNDTPEKVAMIREAKLRDEKLLQQAEDRAYGRISQEKQKEIDAERRADEQLTNAIDDIEDTYNVDLTSKDPVARKQRVDFMNFVEKIAPKDEHGEIVEFPDMLSAYETFQEMKKVEKPNRAKELASRSMSRSSDTIPQPQKRLTFDDADTIFSKMFKKD